jgi:hypothetical protein
MNTVEINGEYIPVDECRRIIKALYNDAKQIAGVFHNMERSAKFRLNWPNEDDFADSEWRNFVEAARSMYAERLNDPKTPPKEARQMMIAVILEARMARGAETDNRLQLAPNTQQFEGDKAENRKIMDTFGPRPNLRAVLRNGAAKFARTLN